MAGLSGTYLAMLATTGATAASRFTPPSGVPLIRTDGVVVIDDYSTFFSATKLRAGIQVTANGLYTSGTVFTGAQSPTMMATTGSCADWTGTSGNGVEGEPSQTTSLYFSNGSVPCSEHHLLYCLQSN
jgi:hypothetical protein